MTRLIICIDLDTDNVEEAYNEVRNAMDKSPLEWESSDEWYDVDGEEGDPEELQHARMRVFNKELAK